MIIVHQAAFASLLLILVVLPCAAGAFVGTVYFPAPDSHVEAGTSLEFQLGVDLYQRKDYSRALHYFRLAALQGDVQAIVQVGLMYDFGQGTTQNYQEAMRWYELAADKGDPFAMYLIGHMFEFGEGVPVNHAEAQNWYLKSARHGHVNAQYAVGKILTRDNTNLSRYKDGIKWLQLAADQCHEPALELLQVVATGIAVNSACSGG